MRHVLFAVLIVFPLTGAAAAQDDFALQKAYNDRLLAMDDSAAAHVELAKWCEEKGLADRALVHWQEALSRDPENAEAKRALGLDSPVAAKAAEPASPRPRIPPSSSASAPTPTRSAKLPGGTSFPPMKRPGPRDATASSR